MTYPNVNFKWSSTPGAKRYEASIAVTFTERIWADARIHDLVSETDRVVRWDLGEETADDAEGGEEIKLPVNGEAFYQFLASRLDADPLITRELGEWNNNIDRIGLLTLCSALPTKNSTPTWRSMPLLRASFKSAQYTRTLQEAWACWPAGPSSRSMAWAFLSPPFKNWWRASTQLPFSFACPLKLRAISPNTPVPE